MEKAVNSNKYRFERKFVISGFYNRELESTIKNHPALFREIFELRQVNNIYFDTYDFRNYMDNVSGNANRIKIRIRWYGQLFGKIERPVLEFKIKRAFAGQKKSYRLVNFDLDSTLTIQKIISIINNSQVPEFIQKSFKDLQPTLLNCYKRRYFLSASKQYRITLDEEMEYYRIRSYNNHFNQKFRDYHNTIIELKYSSNADSVANDISTLFPFRMTKSSKYVNGIDKFYGTTL